MYCRAGMLALAAVMALAPRARGQAEPPRREAIALQEVFQRIIARAEPSIACVLVSRSEDYGRYGAAPGDAGQLGRFDSQRHLLRFQRDQNTAIAAIKALDLSRPETVPEAFGSGLVIDDHGLVLTCAHVVRRATKIYVRLPPVGERGELRGSYADIYAADPRSDLAVLKLLDPPPHLQALKLGDADSLRKGQWVVSLANPYAVGFRDGSPSASVGVVSNLRRRGPAMPSEVEAALQPLHSFGTLLQTDVRVGRGSSGGAVLNLDGSLVGLTTALAAVDGADTPAGFAIPMDAPMRRIVEVLRRGEEVEYGFLGISMDRDLLPGDPVVIRSAIRGGPADAAGLGPGDCIVAVDGRPVRDRDDLLLLIGVGLAGREVKIEVMQAGRRRTETVVLAKSPISGPCIAARRPPAQAGLRVDYSSIVARQQEEVPFGVAVREVAPKSPADAAGLQVGRIITAVDGQRVGTPTAFRRALDAAGKKVRLTVLGLDGQREETIVLDR